MPADFNCLFATPNYADVGPVYSPVLSGGSWEATLPLANLQDRRLDKVARSTNDALTSTKMDVDLGVARPVRVAALVGHNMTLAPTLVADWATVGDAAWTLSGTPTRSAGATTVNGIPLDLVGDDDAAGFEYFRRGVGFIGNGDKIISFVVKKNSTYASHHVRLLDNTAVDYRCRCNIDFTAAVPVITIVGGRGSVLSTVDLGDGGYRITLKAVGVIAANSHTLDVLPGGEGGASDVASFYIGGIKIWDPYPIARVRARGFSALPIIDWATVGDGSWTNTGTPTRVPAATTVAGISLDLIGDDAATQEDTFRVISFTGNGDKVVSFVVKRFSAYASHRVSITDETAPANRLVVIIDFTTSTPVVAIAGGFGSVLSTVSLGDGGWRITARVPGIVAANTNRLYVIPASGAAADTASLYVGDIQAWNADQPQLIYDAGWEEVSPDIYPADSIPTWHPSHASRRLTPEDADDYPMGFTHVTPTIPYLARYWRIEIDDTLNVDGYVEIGRLVLAAGYQMPVNFRTGARQGWETATIRTETDGGAAVFQEKPRRRVTTIAFEGIPQVQATTWLFEILRKLGTHGQLYFVFDPTDTHLMHRRSYLCVLRELGPLEYPEPLHNSAAFALVEEL